MKGASLRTKAFRVGANLVAFFNKGQGEVVLMHGGRGKLWRALSNKCRVVFTFFVKAYPLPKKIDVRVILKKMLPQVNDRNGEKNPISGIC